MSNIRQDKSHLFRRPLNLFIAAGVLHLVVTAGVYTAGRLAILPIVDRNGCTTSVTPDCPGILIDANSSAETLTQSGPIAWLKAPGNLHIKTYSVSLAILGPLLGANILSGETVNILCYLAILGLTFKLGKEVFDGRVGLAATVAVALWPSFLLHTTQPLKDQLFITLLLMLVLIMTFWLTRAFSWRRGLATGVAGGLIANGISLTRSGFWGVVIVGIVMIGVSVLLVRQIREKRMLRGNMISACLILCAASVAPLFVPQLVPPTPTPAPSIITPTAEVVTPTSTSPPSLSPKQRADAFARHLSAIRKQFWHHQDSGSDVDTHVEFASTGDVLRYLPRAAVIGLLAPFPNRWVFSGKRVGITGHLLIGLETTLMYVVQILALIGLWRSRPSLPAWLLFFVSVGSVTIVPVVVTNLGALYRMRYGFFFILLIVGAQGLMTLRPNRNGREVTVAEGGEKV